MGTVLLCTSSFIMKYSSFGLAGYTGSPGESTCGNCHAGGKSSTTVDISSIPTFTNNMFDPGSTYTINISVSNSFFTDFGFGCEILNPQDSSAGTMTLPMTGVKFVTAFNGRQNAVHTSIKTGLGSSTFSFEWVAPPSGSVTIYAAGNAVDFSGTVGGDKANSTFLTLGVTSFAGVIEKSSKNISGLTIFPNPSSQNINFKYFLTTNANVMAVLCDINGKEVTELFNEKQMVGLQIFRSTLSSSFARGIYVLKFLVNEKQCTQRLIIVQ